jgi:uncharacterized protein YPO0396
MYSLFSTDPGTAGYRLQYMEVYNWGTFHGKIFKINPQGNNSLLTGANASGKSTYIDALLTLLVPVKKDRFYNQSSGVDKKGDRTEETYVLGNYGNIQKEGETKASSQTLRDKNTYSVILACFSNKAQRNVTLFQVRWFSNGELKRSFGIARIPLHIENDFSNFDSKLLWKKRIEQTYNGGKKEVDFFDGPGAYADKIVDYLGLRSIKALSLFNQVVGVKVLEDLDEFIRTNMLEEQDAETEFIQLKDSFLTLMDAKTNIEKAKEQIFQLTPINEIAIKLNQIQADLKQLNHSKEVGVYWLRDVENLSVLDDDFSRFDGIVLRDAATGVGDTGSAGAGAASLEAGGFVDSDGSGEGSESGASTKLAAPTPAATPAGVAPNPEVIADLGAGAAELGAGSE